MVSLMTCHNTDVHLPFDGGSIKVGAWSFVDLPGSSRLHATFGDPRHETFNKLLQQFQDEVLLDTRRPLGPTADFGVELGILILKSIEHRLLARRVGGICPKTAGMRSGISIRRVGRSSSLSTSSTCFLCSDASANEDANDGWD